MRAFVAIDLDPGIRGAVQALIGRLEATRADVRWAGPAGLHLTLKFLGEIDEAAFKRAQAVLGRVASRHRAFPLVAQGTGVFPGERNPRVLWIGFAAEPGLAALQDELERTLETEGFPREDRPFRPHLTLGRVKGPVRIADALAELLRRRDEVFGRMTADSIALFESRLGPAGADYRIVAEARLA